MSIPSSLGPAKVEILDARNPVIELFTRWFDEAGLIQYPPSYLAGTCTDTDIVGTFAYVSGYTSSLDVDVHGNPDPTKPIYAPVWTKCDPTTPGKNVPQGVIEYKTGAALCTVRELKGDIAYAGIVGGMRYVVGTDGLPAKVGDSNYPTVAQPYNVGIGLYPGRLLLCPDAAVNQGGGSGKIAAESAAVTANNTETDFSVTTTVKGNTLAGGARIIIEGAVRSGTVTDTHTGVLRLYIGTLKIFESAALDPVNAGDVFNFRDVVEVRTIGASGTIVSSGEVSCKGDVLGLRASGGGAGSQVLDTTVDQILKASWQWSGAGDTCVLQSLRYSVGQ